MDNINSNFRPNFTWRTEDPDETLEYCPYDYETIHTLSLVTVGTDTWAIGTTNMNHYITDSIKKIITYARKLPKV